MLMIAQGSLSALPLLLFICLTIFSSSASGASSPFDQHRSSTQGHSEVAMERIGHTPDDGPPSPLKWATPTFYYYHCCTYTRNTLNFFCSFHNTSESLQIVHSSGILCILYILFFPYFTFCLLNVWKTSEFMRTYTKFYHTLSHCWQGLASQ